MNSEIPDQSQNIKKLENERFPVSPESLSFLKEARVELKEFQKEIPEVNGMVFFGSRTVGNESEQSDLDCRLFYDGSNNWINVAPQLVYNGETGEFDSTGKFDRQKLNDQKIIVKIRTGFYFNHFKKNSKFKYEISDVQDICSMALDEYIEEFRDLIEREEKGLKNPIKKEELPSSTAWDITAPFLLGIGDGLYQARKYILDVLEKQEDGEKIWKNILKYLSHIERDASTDKRYSLPSFKGYPKTIAEARGFFLTKEY